MTKIGIDGKPYDPAEKAANGHVLLRKFVEYLAHKRLDNGELVLDYAEYGKLDFALNYIADRLATCDALEMKVASLEKERYEMMVRLVGSKKRKKSKIPLVRVLTGQDE